MTDLHMKWFSGVVIAVVVFAVIAAFILVGSPQNARNKKIDDIRTMHLSSLQYELAEYWRVHKTMPDSLEELPSGGRSMMLRDPQTNVEYGYTTLSDSSFELCAVFSAKSEVVPSLYGRVPYNPYGQFLENAEQWDHEVGRVCFIRTINPAYYTEHTNDGAMKPVPATL